SQSWLSWHSLGGQFANPVTVAESSTGYELYGVFTDGRIYRGDESKSVADGTIAWTPISGAGVQGIASAASGDGFTYTVAARFSDNSIRCSQQASFGSNTFGPWVKVADGATSDPVVVANANGVAIYWMVKTAFWGSQHNYSGWGPPHALAGYSSPSW